MKENTLTQICKEFDFPAKSLPALEAAYLSVAKSSEANTLFQTALDSLLRVHQIVFDEATKKLLQLTNLQPYTLNILLCVLALEPLRKIYAEAGKTASFDQYVKALKQTLVNTKEQFGVWGIQTAFWQWMFHDWRCVELGRLIFEPYYHFCDISYKNIQKGDPVILIHIPEGGPLDMEKVMESVDRGYHHFKDRFSNGVVPFITHSWLLYPPYLNGVFKEGGNLQKFAGLFDVISQNENYSDSFAHVFGCPYPGEGSLDNVPQKTSVQRNMLQFIKQGNALGDGYGIFFYDANGIVR